jgi:outer membrane biosynthesis protein TonB
MAAALAWSLVFHVVLFSLRSDALPQTCEDCGAATGDRERPTLSVTLVQGKPVSRPSAFVDRTRLSDPWQENGRTGTKEVAAASIGLGQQYYGPAELTRHARAIGDIQPLPDELERASDSGRLVLILRISAAGTVDEIETNESTLGDQISAAIKDRFRKLRFHPAEIDGVAVNSRMKIEVILAPPTRA